MQLGDLFKLRRPVSSQAASVLSFSGIIALLLLWYIPVAMGWISPRILPGPVHVAKAYGPLLSQDGLIDSVLYSFKLNFISYIEACLISIPLGFIIGLFPITRESLRTPLDALRFLPMTALIAPFIFWFGIGDAMKIQFLAASIAVFLLPVVVQRVQETNETYVQAVRTLSASRWHRIQHVFIPDVLSKIFDDIRVMVAVSWTYIIVVEGVNNTGGVGALCFLSGRQCRFDKVFAVLLVIILIGYIQDKIFMWADKLLFPHKYQGVSK